MTVHWIISVVFTFLAMDSSNDATTVCYGSDNASDCIQNKVLETLIPIMDWLNMVTNLLYVNVSTVHHAVQPVLPAS
jgi:hypothetical protein